MSGERRRLQSAMSRPWSVAVLITGLSAPFVGCSTGEIGDRSDDVFDGGRAANDASLIADATPAIYADAAGNAGGDGSTPDAAVDAGTGVDAGAVPPPPNPIDCAEPGTGAFLEAGGLVIIEAESEHAPEEGSWARATEGETTYLVATSNHFGNTNGQTLNYRVRIGRPGVYRLHMKSAFSGTDPTEENDTWFKVDNTSEIHFFTVEGGALDGTEEFISLRDGASTDKTLFYPAGNTVGRPDFGRENPGRDGFFKIYRSGNGGNKWDARTIDNHGYPVYVYFPSPGDHVVQMSERSAGHQVDRFALAHIDDVGSGIPESALDGPPSQRANVSDPPPFACAIRGDLEQWHRAALVCTGPFGSEDCPEVFTDLRMNVSMSDGSRSLVVPGHFAADGEAGTTGASAGRTWRAYFMPPASGTWTYTVSMRAGPGVAVSLDPEAGARVAGLDGLTGTFTVARSDATGHDFRAHGLLEHRDGERYLRFASSGRFFVEGGADSPENLFGFDQFDNTEKFSGGSCKGILHTFAPHATDWRPGDPTWGADERGKPLIGLINYLASKGVNAIYVVAMSVEGDGCDGYPWASYFGSRRVFDVSKLDQWDIAFSHMTASGVLIHYVTQETENDQLLDNGSLGLERRLYYREIVSRFAHHPALQWNLGEENTNSADEVKAYADYIRSIDPYDHPIVMHTYPNQKDRYEPLLGHPTFNGPTLQFGNIPESADQGLYGETRSWLDRSARAGRQWYVTATEASGNDAPTPDTAVTTRQRVYWMWANVMAGGAGIEWYLKNDGVGHAYDLAVEDQREFDAHWTQTGHLVRFFNDIVQDDGVTLQSLRPANDATSTGSDWVLADDGSAYIVFLRDGGATDITTTGTGSYLVSWFDPRSGQLSQAASIPAGATVSLGAPPTDTSQDWVIFVRR